MAVDWGLAEAQLPLSSFVLRRGSRYKDVLPRQIGDAFRGSSLRDICPRQEVLCNIHQVFRQDEIEPDLAYIFAVGNGIHEAIQQSLLKDIIVGAWRCRGCGAVYGSMEELIPMPERCVGRLYDHRTEELTQCPNHNFSEDVITDWHLPGFKYKEIDLHHEDPLVYSHPDGVLWRGKGLPPQGLTFDNPLLELLEIKSASWVAMLYGYGHGKIAKAPVPYHVDQAMLYMWILGIKRGRLLYVRKEGRGIRSSFIEHTIDLDDDHVRDNILTIPQTIDEGIESRDPTRAQRICNNKSCARARACPVRKECWSTDE